MTTRSPPNRCVRAPRPPISAASPSPAAPGANRGFFEQMARTMALSAPDQARIVQDAETSRSATSARAILELMTTDMRPLLPQIKAPTTVLAAWASTRAFGGSR